MLRTPCCEGGGLIELVGIGPVEHHDLALPISADPYRHGIGGWAPENRTGGDPDRRGADVLSENLESNT